MYTYYDGAYSVYFGDKNTWADWHLIPLSRPVIQPPPIHTNTVEVPGANGYVDLTDFPTGFPTYGNRAGSLDFAVDNSADNWDWDHAYDVISNYLHGAKLKMVLCDKAGNKTPFYYEGRFSVSSWTSDKMYSKITINYDVFPYRLVSFSTQEPWPWNPFDFRYGVIIDKSDFTFTADSESTWTPLTTWTSDYLGLMPLTPTFTVSAANGIDIEWCNWNPDASRSIDPHAYYHQYHLINGVNSIPTIQFATPKPGDRTSFNFKGVGTVAIDFRQGRL